MAVGALLISGPSLVREAAQSFHLAHAMRENGAARIFIGLMAFWCAFNYERRRSVHLPDGFCFPARGDSPGRLLRWAPAMDQSGLQLGTVHSQWPCSTESRCPVTDPFRKVLLVIYNRFDHGLNAYRDIREEIKSSERLNLVNAYPVSVPIRSANALCVGHDDCD